MRVGPHGLLQPSADGIKLMLKEDIVPSQADRWYSCWRRSLSLIPAFIVFAVIPLRTDPDGFTIPGAQGTAIASLRT